MPEFSVVSDDIPDARASRKDERQEVDTPVVQSSEGARPLEKLTLFQWIERLSYRFLGPTFTSFVIRRRFVLTRFFLVFVYWLVGVQYYQKEEGWTAVDSAYFITVTTTTVGYGDYHPTRDATKLFTIFYAMFGIAFVLSAVSDIISYLIVRKLQTKVLNFLKITNIETKAWCKLIFSICCILLMVVIGTAFFKANEGWSTITSLYWTIITMLTIGYGDETVSESSRQFSIWFIWTCVVIYIMAISNILDTLEELKNAALRNEILRAHRVDILELLENDRKGRDTIAPNSNARGLLFGRNSITSLPSIYPSTDDEVKYESSPIDQNNRGQKGDIELAIGAPKPTINPLMNKNSLKALFKSVSDPSSSADSSLSSNATSSTTSSISTSHSASSLVHGHQTVSVSGDSSLLTPSSSSSSSSSSSTSSSAATSSSSNLTNMFFGSRGSIEPSRNSSYSENTFRSSSIAQGANGRRPTVFGDLEQLENKQNRFVLEMLIKMKKVDQERDILPLIKHFEAIGLMREEHKDASKEAVAKMFVETLGTEKSTLSSFAATLVGNKKIVVQKRASEIEKIYVRRESSDPRADQAKNLKQFQPGGGRLGLTSFGFETVDDSNPHSSGSSSSSGGDHHPVPSGRQQARHLSDIQVIAEGEEDEDS